jgi:DNA polymerase IV
MRTIAHLDMDAFYVSVELLRRPELRGLPVVVSGAGPRAVVTTASYEARVFGVRSAIPASRARRLCPQAIFIPPDGAYYREASRGVFAIVREHVETVEQLGLDEGYLDLTGMVAPRAAMRRLIAAIQEGTGLTASVGIGPNRLVAKMASDAEKPRGFVVMSREDACSRFASSPPGLIPGIGPKTAERLRELGIETVAALAAADPERLAQRFGPRTGPWLVCRARFEDDSPVSTERIAVSESRETTFDVDIADAAQLEGVLLTLTDQLCAGLAKSGRRGRTVRIKVRLDDFSTHTRARTLPVAVGDAGAIGRVAVELLREFAAPRPLRLIGVGLAGFEDAGEATQQMALPV